MKVKNIHTTHIGFGEMRLLPGESIDISKLPRGYGLDNPAVKFYIGKKWLEVTGTDSGTVKAQAVSVSTKLPTDGDDVKSGALKSVSRMNLDELKALAAEMQLEVVESETRNMLIERIKAAKKTEE